MFSVTGRDVADSAKCTASLAIGPGGGPVSKFVAAFGYGCLAAETPAFQADSGRRGVAGCGLGAAAASRVHRIELQRRAQPARCWLPGCRPAELPRRPVRRSAAVLRRLPPGHGSGRLRRRRGPARAASRRAPCGPAGLKPALAASPHAGWRSARARTWSLVWRAMAALSGRRAVLLSAAGRKDAGRRRCEPPA